MTADRRAQDFRSSWLLILRYVEDNKVKGLAGNICRENVARILG